MGVERVLLAVPDAADAVEAADADAPGDLDAQGGDDVRRRHAIDFGAFDLVRTLASVPAAAGDPLRRLDGDRELEGAHVVVAGEPREGARPERDGAALPPVHVHHRSRHDGRPAVQERGLRDAGQAELLLAARDGGGAQRSERLDAEPLVEKLDATDARDGLRVVVEDLADAPLHLLDGPRREPRGLLKHLKVLLGLALGVVERNRHTGCSEKIKHLGRKAEAGRHDPVHQQDCVVRDLVVAAEVPVDPHAALGERSAFLQVLETHVLDDEAMRLLEVFDGGKGGHAGLLGLGLEVHVAAARRQVPQLLLALSSREQLRAREVGEDLVGELRLHDPDRELLARRLEGQAARVVPLLTQHERALPRGHDGIDRLFDDRVALLS